MYAEHGARLACLSVSLTEQRMKAVLEFTYPQDEGKLKHALRGEEYYLALIEIERVLRNPHQFGDRADMFDRIAFILEGVLEDEH
jgi:hypothetical protein